MVQGLDPDAETLTFKTKTVPPPSGYGTRLRRLFRH